MDTVRIAVVGAGVMGLSTAVCISKMVPGCSITVISDKFTPETTSDVAAGMLIPPTYPDTPIQKQKQWFKETFDHLFAIVNSTEAEDAGVILVSGWQIFRSIPTEEVPYWADVVLGFRKMTKDELKKFPQHVFGHAFTTLKCEGPAYLPWLQKSPASPTASALLPGLTDSRAHTTPSADGQKRGLCVRQETGRLCLTNVQLAKVPSCAHWTPASPHPTYPVPASTQASFSRVLENSCFSQHWLLAPNQTNHGQKLASDTGLM